VFVTSIDAGGGSESGGTEMLCAYVFFVFRIPLLAIVSSCTRIRSELIVSVSRGLENGVSMVELKIK
jgi:MFS-type transporter involved in bile tolerance (Atg22 family)